MGMEKVKEEANYGISGWLKNNRFSPYFHLWYSYGFSGFRILIFRSRRSPALFSILIRFVFFLSSQCSPDPFVPPTAPAVHTSCASSTRLQFESISSSFHITQRRANDILVSFPENYHDPAWILCQCSVLWVQNNRDTSSSFSSFLNPFLSFLPQTSILFFILLLFFYSFFLSRWCKERLKPWSFIITTSFVRDFKKNIGWDLHFCTKFSSQPIPLLLFPFSCVVRKELQRCWFNHISTIGKEGGKFTRCAALGIQTTTCSSLSFRPFSCRNDSPGALANYFSSLMMSRSCSSLLLTVQRKGIRLLS